MKTEKSRTYRFLFGPVHSRRLGVSLGIDLLPHKTCSLDCVYCECGKTTRLTLKRSEYLPTDAVIEELDSFLSRNPKLDFITFSGAGEPTLHSGIGKIIDFIKSRFSRYRVALLTNGSLLIQSQVRQEIAGADLVIASLDAATTEKFNSINRPHPMLKMKDLIDGLSKFKNEHPSSLQIEIFIVPGLNDDEYELDSLKKALNDIRPNYVQLNTLDRPGTENWVQPATMDSLYRIAQHLGGADLIRFKMGTQDKFGGMVEIRDQIFSTLKRRPCTAEDLKNIFGLKETDLQDLLNTFILAGIVEKKEMTRGVFYKIRE
jgi:wyosine [tRNA(Phe)-imidazoG37] synthetase (radical SAM superfamily)